MHERSGMIGLFASFMAIIGAGGDISANIKTGSDFKIDVARLQTLKFEPPGDYLRQTLELPENLQFLREHKFKKQVYMVTSVKIAYGGRISRSKSLAFGGEGRFGLDPAVPGLQVGPKASFSQTKKDAEEVGASFDFVYAFRLNKIHYSSRKQKYIQERYIKGATLAKESKEDDSRASSSPSLIPEGIEDEDREGVDVELLGLEEECAGTDEFELSGQDVLDEEDGEVCILVTSDGSTE